MGGYSYSYFIPGPVGINLGMLKSPEKYSGNVSACSLCYSCSNVCPVKIDLAEQIYKWRQNLHLCFSRSIEEVDGEGNEVYHESSRFVL